MDQINRYAPDEITETVIVSAADSRAVIEVTRGTLHQRQRIARKLAVLMNEGGVEIHFNRKGHG